MVVLKEWWGLLSLTIIQLKTPPWEKCTCNQAFSQNGNALLLQRDLGLPRRCASMTLPEQQNTCQQESYWWTTMFKSTTKSGSEFPPFLLAGKLFALVLS
jgi:hypothetical protein